MICLFTSSALNPLYLQSVIHAICHYMYESILSSIVFLSLCFFFCSSVCLNLILTPPQLHRVPTQMQTLLILMRSGAHLGPQVASPQHHKPNSNPQIQVEQAPFPGHIAHIQTTLTLRHSLVLLNACMYSRIYI